MLSASCYVLTLYSLPSSRTDSRLARLSSPSAQYLGEGLHRRQKYIGYTLQDDMAARAIIDTVICPRCHLPANPLDPAYAAC
ncbi:hypothetical protein FB451DRAFT_1390437 [Mycena latifolia]|nr:hypothetical protein FB451DRAFT_1390437 [Mycena latifolia]